MPGIRVMTELAPITALLFLFSATTGGHTMETGGAQAPAAQFSREDLIALLDLIYPGRQPELDDMVYGLAIDPEGYFAAHADEFEDFDEPYPELYRDVLLYVMREDDNERAWLFDWKQGHDGINYGLGLLSGGKYAAVLTDADGEAEWKSAGEFLAIAARRILERGDALLEVDRDTDSHTVFIVGAAEAGRVLEYGRRCGMDVRPFTTVN